MLKVAATFDRFSSRADGSFGLGFSTQEAGLEELAQLQGHVRQFGWLLFDENPIQDEDIPDERPEREGKSPSKRLYNVLFAYHAKLKEDGKLDEPFEPWRERQMEKIIERIKTQLD